MNTSKRISWHAAAIAAAALVASSAAHADHRGGERRYEHNRGHNDRNYREYRDWNGGSHHRVWRDHGRGYYPYAYTHYRYPSVRYYDYRPARQHYYGQRGYYEGASFTIGDFGTQLTIAFPLR